MHYRRKSFETTSMESIGEACGAPGWFAKICYVVVLHA